jgi:hypothetical protein
MRGYVTSKEGMCQPVYVLQCPRLIVAAAAAAAAAVRCVRTLTGVAVQSVRV